MFRLLAVYILLSYSFAQAANPVASLNFKGGEQGRILIDVKINDQGPFPFIFDTGSINIISRDLARQLGTKITGKRTLAAFGGSVETASAIIDSIKPGEITMGRTEVVVYRWRTFHQRRTGGHVGLGVPIQAGR